MSNREMARGSVWRQWDLHVHTPASFHWFGKKFRDCADANERRDLVDQMIDALNKAEPAVFAIMDYWTFDGWLALKSRLSENGAPTLHKKVFPGIELRLAAPMKGRLNAHVLFSDEIEDQALLDFKQALTIELVNRPLSDSALMDAAREAGADKLKTHGFDKPTWLRPTIRPCLLAPSSPKSTRIPTGQQFPRSSRDRPSDSCPLTLMMDWLK